MAKYSYIVNNLAGGELSPRQHGRTDIENVYKNGCYRMDNYATRSTSGAIKRTGTSYIGAATGQRFFSFKGFTFGLVPIVYPPLLDIAKPAANKVAFSTAYSYPSATVNAPAYRDSATAGLYKNIYDDSSYADAPAAPFSKTYYRSFMSIATDFYLLSNDLAHSAQFTEVGDVLVICDRGNPPIFLKHEGGSVFTEYSFRDFAGVPVDFTDSDNSAYTSNFAAQWMLGTPYRDLVVNKTAQPVMSVSAVTLGASVTVTITNAASWGGGFTRGHIGAIFLSTISSKTGAVVITSVNASDPTEATGRVLRTFGGTGAISNWRESSWSNARGWPRTVTYAQGRLFFGGNTSEPDRVWASQAFDIGQFAPHALFDRSVGGTPAAVATDAFANNILSSRIQWLTNNDNNIFIGTSDREYIVDLNVGSTTTTLSSRPQTSYGSSYIQAIPVNNAIIFVDSSGALRELAFNFNDDNFTAENLSDLADHLPLEAGVNKLNLQNAGTAIKAIGLQRAPDSRIFVLTNGGGFFCITRDRLKNVASWSRLSFPGVGSASAKDIDTFCVTGSAVELKTNRVINDVAVSYHEEFTFNEYKSPVLFTGQAHAGSGVSYSRLSYLDLFTFAGPAGSATIGSLNHLEGQVVRCLAFITDDNVFKDFGHFTVSSNQIVLPEAVNYAYVGLDFAATIVPLPPDVGAVLENAQGVMKRTDEVIIRFYRSIGCSIAPCEIVLEDFSRTTSGQGHLASVYTPQATRDFEELDFVPANQALNKQLPLFTGDKSMLLDSDYDERAMVMIKSESPYPSIIAAIIFKGETYE